MKTAGGLTKRRAAQSAVAVSAAILIALTGVRVTAYARDAGIDDATAADTAAAAAIYEAVPAESPATPPTAKPSPGAPAASGAGSAKPSGASASPPAVRPSPPSATETVIVPASMPAPSYISSRAGLPSTTTVIPQSSAGPEPGTAEIDRNADNAQTIDYDARQNPQLIEPQLHSLQEFMSEGDETSPLGIEMREDRRKLSSGEVADGLLIVDVRTGSAAARAGLHPYRRTTRDILEGAAIVASMVFAPAVLAVPLFDQVKIGESYDMIIGVDGTRVTNFLDFEDCMRDVQPGEIVYLSIVRNGKRLQVPVPVQSLPPAVF
jgi:hypothetical protein